ncbi:MAG: hypothetical protein ACREP1_12700 [Rhodanobacteraceae bacterium]
MFGRGIGLLLSGGRGGILTTTKLIADALRPAPEWRIFDLGGPLGNLAWAELCPGLQRLIRNAAPSWKLFLWTSAMFSLFWEFGYLMKCGVTGRGDGTALVEGLNPAGVWRALLFLGGLMLYRAAIRVLASDLHAIVSSAESEWRSRLRRLLWTVYFAGGMTACAGAILDPRGPGEIFNSGVMSSFAASLGLVFIPILFPSHPDKNSAVDDSLRGSFLLVALAAIVLLLFVLVFGPGIHVSA